MRNLKAAIVFACLGSSWLWAACAYGAHFADPQQEACTLVSLMRERLALMPDVAYWKFTHSLLIRDPAREAIVLDDAQKQANELGLDGALVREFFRVQMDAASALEEQKLARFKAGEHVGEVRDLTRELRPRLDAIGKRLMSSLYLMATEMHASGAPMELHLADALRLGGFTAGDGRELEQIILKMRLIHPPSWSAVKQSGVLRIGTTADYAPFSSLAHDTLVGSDIASAAAFAQSLGLKPVFVRTTWPTLLSDYRDNRFDVAVGGISVTAERSAFAKFTRPYHRGGKTPIVRCGTEQAFDTLEKIDSAQVRVIVNPGGTNEQFADQHFHRARVIVFPDNTRIFDEIADGRADVMVTDDAEVDLQVSHNPSLCRATKQIFTQSAKAWMLIDIPELAKVADDWLATYGATSIDESPPAPNRN